MVDFKKAVKVKGGQQLQTKKLTIKKFVFYPHLQKYADKDLLISRAGLNKLKKIGIVFLPEKNYLAKFVVAGKEYLLTDHAFCRFLERLELHGWWLKDKFNFKEVVDLTTARALKIIFLVFKWSKKIARTDKVDLIQSLDQGENIYYRLYKKAIFKIVENEIVTMYFNKKEFIEEKFNI